MKLREKLKARLVASDFYDTWWPPRFVEHVQCGMHSGFPPCCIAWFVTGWVWVRAARTLLFREGVEYVRMSDGEIVARDWWPDFATIPRLPFSLPFDEMFNDGPPPGYVRCPWCQKMDVRALVKECEHPELDGPYPEAVESLGISPNRVKAVLDTVLKRFNNMDELAKMMGFENEDELHRMVAAVDLSTLENRDAFFAWKKGDGTKEGLKKLPTNR